MTTPQSHLLLWGGLIFGAVFLGALGIWFLVLDRRQKRVQRRLQEVAARDATNLGPEIVRDLKLSSLPLLDRMLRQLRFTGRLELLIEQADASLTVGTLVLLMATLAAGGALLGQELTPVRWMALPAAAFLASVPLLVLFAKKRRRIQRFEAELPDALDLITGALRAGMAFTGALQLVAEESPDPIAKEFTIVFEEHQLGIDLREALAKMSRRVESRELQLFVAAVVLQRETGGNLSEILESSAEIVRDRFRILGDVRTITAQARLSGLVLICLPLVMGAVLALLVPDYMKLLVADHVGRMMLGAALVLQVLGILLIRRIVSIEV